MCDKGSRAPCWKYVRKEMYFVGDGTELPNDTRWDELELSG